MAEQHHHHQNHDQDGLRQAPVVVITVPLLAQGHLNQFLQLSHLISSYNIQVHYIGPAMHKRQVKLRAHGLNPMDNTKICFHDFSIPPFLSPPPNPSASINSPHTAHLQPSIEASMHLHQPVSALFLVLPMTKRMIIIHDPLIASVVQDAPSIPYAEAYVFHCVSAFSVFTYLWEALRKPFPLAAEILNELPSMEGCFTCEIVNFSAHQYEFAKTADRGDIFTGEIRRAERPQGYEERVEAMRLGMVVRHWAPQLEILGHVPTGGFMSHCGWNSCMESITMGIPIAPWPMHSDQPRNSLLVTQVLKVVLVVREWEHREELVTSSTIEKALRRLMASKEGNDIRKNAVEFGLCHPEVNG